MPDGSSIATELLVPYAQGKTYMYNNIAFGEWETGINVARINWLDEYINTPFLSRLTVSLEWASLESSNKKNVDINEVFISIRMHG